jgi:hypothetical protein
MRKLFCIGLLALTALVAPAVAHASSHVSAVGWALEDNGSRCGSDCTAFMETYFTNDHSGYHLASGPVSNSSTSCAGSTLQLRTAGPYPRVPDLQQRLRFADRVPREHDRQRLDPAQLSVRRRVLLLADARGEVDSRQLQRVAQLSSRHPPAR